MWAFAFCKRFSLDTAPTIVELLVTLLLFLSSTLKPFIYAATNRVFLEEFHKLLCWLRVRKITSEAGSGANRKGGSGEKTPEQDEIDV